MREHTRGDLTFLDDDVLRFFSLPPPLLLFNRRLAIDRLAFHSTTHSLECLRSIGAERRRRPPPAPDPTWWPMRHDVWAEGRRRSDGVGLRLLACRLPLVRSGVQSLRLLPQPHGDCAKKAALPPAAARHSEAGLHLKSTIRGRLLSNNQVGRMPSSPPASSFLEAQTGGGR